MWQHAHDVVRETHDACSAIGKLIQIDITEFWFGRKLARDLRALSELSFRQAQGERVEASPRACHFASRAARSTASITRRTLPPRIFVTSASEYPFFSSASVILGSFDASSIPSGIVAPSKSEPRPT